MTRIPDNYEIDQDGLRAAKLTVTLIMIGAPLAAMIGIGGFMAVGLKIGHDETVRAATVRQEIDAPLTIRTASAVQRELAR